MDISCARSSDAVASSMGQAGSGTLVVVVLAVVLVVVVLGVVLAEALVGVLVGSPETDSRS